MALANVLAFGRIPLLSRYARILCNRLCVVETRVEWGSLFERPLHYLDLAPNTVEVSEMSRQ